MVSGQSVENRAGVLVRDQCYPDAVHSPLLQTAISTYKFINHTIPILSLVNRLMATAQTLLFSVRARPVAANFSLAGFGLNNESKLRHVSGNRYTSIGHVIHAGVLILTSNGN